MVTNMKYILTIFFLLSVVASGQETQNEFEELANGYINQGKPIQAAEFYSKAGYAFWNKGNSAHAAVDFEKAYALFSSQGNIFASVTVANNLGLIYLDMEKYHNAYNAFNNVLSFSRKSKNKTEIFNSLVNLGSIDVEISSYGDAISKTSEALLLAKESNNLKSIAKCYSILAESYEKAGDGTNAYKYFELYSSIDQEIKKQEMESVKEMSEEEINKAHEKKRITEIELKIKKGELKLTQDSLTVSERLAFQRQMQVELRNEQLNKKEIQLRLERQIRRNLIVGIVFIFLFLVALGLLLRQKLRDNKTLKLQKEEITIQRNKLDEQNKKITDSIHYGLRIQNAMLPDLKELEKRFDLFVLFKPKDIVSGDFYWFYETREGESVYQFIAVVDCTGHGVPGAFMSMIGHRLLSEVVIERKTYIPSQVLELMNINLRKELDQNNKKTTDGMDVAFCRLESVNGQYRELLYAGAKRPFLIVNHEDGKLTIVEADRKGVGGFITDEQKSFADKSYKINKGDILIFYTDGIIDQPNPDRKRFGTNRLTTLIDDHKNEPMAKIKQAIEKSFELYAYPEEQRDDVTVVGLKLI